MKNKGLRPGSKLAISVIVMLLAAVSIATYRYHNEEISALQDARKRSSEPYLELDWGPTRYQVWGKEGDPTVILIHSFNGFIESWSPNIASLVEAGYRVVAYDLWGRGLSARPEIALNLGVFRQQLHALTQALGIEKMHLAGSSFGCVIAADYALKHPGRVEKLVLIGPAGWPSPGDGSSKLLKVPVLGDAVFHFVGNALLKAKVEEYFHNRKGHEWALEQWQHYAAYPGFTRSALSTLRHSPVLDYTDGWRKLANAGKPVMFIWGKKDISFAFSHTTTLAAMMPHAEIVAVEDAAHWVNIEKPRPVNEAMVSFLGR